MGLVFGRDRHLDGEPQRLQSGQEAVQHRPSVIRNFRAGEPMYKTRWSDWKTLPPNEFRNYDVIEMIPRLRLEPGRSIWFRSFLVVGSRDAVVERAKALVDRVDYGARSFDPATTPLRAVALRDGRVVESGEPSFHVYTRPVPGSQPLFVIEDTKTGREVITTDPYVFVPREPLKLDLPASHPASDYFNRAEGYSLDLHHARWKALLGFALVQPPATGSFVRLSSCLGDAFPVADRHHLDVWVGKGGR